MLLLRHAVALRSSSSAAGIRGGGEIGGRLLRAISCSAAVRGDDGGMLEGEEEEEREKMEYDVLTIGAGPAGLAAAIRIKQLSLERGDEEPLSVCVLEKGSEVGAHVLSGNVFEPRALDELFPGWREMGEAEAPPVGHTPVTQDHMYYLTSETGSQQLPHALLPSQLHNEGNFVISLSQLTRWLAQQAEELGVEIYAGFPASEVLYRDDGTVRGVVTREAGIAKDGTRKDTYQQGIEMHARQTIFAEGCRGSCSEALINKFNLREGRDMQTYGLGVKEVWEIPEEHARPGLVQHSLGWPLQNSLFDKTFGGSFLYHMAPNYVLIGLVVGLDYENPTLSPYQEFQRLKHHPEIRKHIEGGRCISYGARCLNEGGFHAIPKLTVPGALLAGDAAGFLNAVKIKGTHTALKTGMLAAEATYDALTANPDCRVGDGGEIQPDEAAIEVADFEDRFRSSWVYEELKEVRNCHAAFKGGLLPGVLHSGLSTFITKGREPWTLSHTTPDSQATKPVSECTPIEYPKPDGTISFDLLTNLQRSGTNHEHDQPAHLRIKRELAHVPSDVSITKYAGPEQHFCPANVYEYTEPDETGKRDLIINAQNCVHCKCCSIKMPEEYIEWTVPEGGGGPGYTVM